MKKIFAFLFTAMLILNLSGIVAKSEIWDGKISGSFSGDGSESSPYLIKTADDLALLSEKVYNGEDYTGKHFLLVNDLVINDTKKFYSWEDIPPENSWRPIGIPRAYFKGMFDGNGKIVSGLYISDDAKNYAGLFGYVKGGEIKNLKLEKVYVAGRSDIGTIVGFAEDTKIENVYADGVIFGKENAGGIAGSLSGSKIENAISLTEVTSIGNAGGIAGYVNKSYIYSAASKGDVVGGVTAGGIAGHLVEGGVKNAYSEGEITAESYAGGITGYMAEKGENEYVYAIGNIISEKASGGIAGASYGNIKSAYFKGFVQGEYKGGIAGINSPLSEESSLPLYGEIENAYYAVDRCDVALGFTMAEDDDHDILGIKASRIDFSFVKRYILNPFVSVENLEENPDSVWVFEEKNPELWFEYSENEETMPEEGTEIGVKIGEIVSTDIRAFINGNELKAVNIAGRMAIALKDLRELGFEVIFDEKNKEVSVSYKGGEVKPSYIYEKPEKEIGSYMSDILSTDITAYVNGEKTESFNSEGYTHIYFRSLSSFGEVSFDETARKAKLEIK